MNKIEIGVMVRISGRNDLSCTHKEYVERTGEVVKRCKSGLLQIKVKGLQLTSVPQCNVDVWHDPGAWPPAPGEYRAVMNLVDFCGSNRRYWNGHQWSGPYHADWPEEIKASLKLETSGFLVHWQPL